ncbi:MAG: hypothetical protein WA789_20165 [Candidatus Acidiferrum sp.]
MTRTSPEWVSVRQVSAALGWTERHVRRVAKRDAWRFEESEGSARNGRRVQLYSADSLPAQVQVKLMQDKIAVTDAALEKPRTLPLFEPQPPERVAIPEKLLPQAESRFRAIKPLLDFRSRTNGHRPAIHLADGRVMTRQTDLAEYIAAQQKPPISPSTLWRWLDRWDEALKKGKNGFNEIIRRRRKDARGAGSRSIMGHAAEAYLQKKYLDKKEGDLSMFMAWEALARDWRTVLREKGEPPSFATARKYLSGLSVGVKTLARVGPEAYLSKCTPCIVRGKQPVMKTWISDHRVHDVMVRNRLFATRREDLDSPYRVWLTAIFDEGSQAIVGHCFSPQPSWRTIHSAIRMAALQYGFPQEFYWDNGEDFKKAKRQLQKIEETKEALGFNFRVTSALPKRPRSKPIEAYFTRFARRFDPMWGDAYLGNSPKNRREHARVAEHVHKRYLEGKASDSPLPADAQFIAAGIQWIEEYNNSPLKQLGGRTPNQVMEEAWPEASRTKIDPRALDILLWEPVVRTVEKGGCVRMDSMWYEPTEEYTYAIANLQGQRIHVLRDPYNLSDAVAVTEDRIFLGELRPKEFIAQDNANPITRDQIQAAMKEQRRLKKMHSQHLAILSLISEQCGWRTERELLEERAAKAMGLTGTDGRAALPAAAVPGASRTAPQSRRLERQMQPAFVSDAVKEDAGFFSDVKVED